jgi:hypothetical protein
MVGRALALILLLAALLAAGHDGFVYSQTGSYMPERLGALWYGLDRGSLNLVQAVIERYIHPLLWQDVLFPLLLWPAWAVLGGAAVILGLLCRKRQRRWRSGSLG